MAETVHLSLLANGTQIRGDSSQTTLGREHTIECVQFEHHAVVPTSQWGATGRRSYRPFRVVKRIDRASPLLLKALTEHHRVEGTFRFFRPSPDGGGTTEQHYAVGFGGGRVVGLRQWLPDVLLPATSTLPLLEEVSITFARVTWTWTNGGVTHEDTWLAAE